MSIPRKKLIEVALPLEAINKASVRENYIYRGNPSALHKWWAQRPLAAARAVIFAQMVDDPSANPDLFKTEKAQEKERQRLFKIIEQLVQWENTSNEEVVEKARAEIWQSWRRACADNVDHPLAKELFDRNKLPPLYDPFAGAGTLPLEAQRLGLKAYASDLNPVAVLISKATIEIPPKFAHCPPVNPDARSAKTLAARQWKGAEGLAEDVRFYGQLIRDEAEKRIGQLYPAIEVTIEMAKERPDLKPLIGQKLTVIAWLWARTVKSPNPAFRDVEVPLASTFMLSTKSGKEAYVQPEIADGTYTFRVRRGKPKDVDSVRRGTKSGGSGTSFLCLMSGTPMPFDYLRSEAKAGRMGARLMAVVAQGERGRVYLPPTPEMEAVVGNAKPIDPPDTDLPAKALGFRVQEYGMAKWRDLFTPRQLVALITFSDLIKQTITRVKQDASDAGFLDDGKSLCNDGSGAQAYAEAVSLYLAMAEDKTAEYGCTIVPWYSKEDRPKGLFARQAIPMVWDYAEVNPLGDIGGTFIASIEIVAGALAGCAAAGTPAFTTQSDAVRNGNVHGAVISTDPPYYDNIGYADLSDFFYGWLRRWLR
jgi:putative DNA methylase